MNATIHLPNIVRQSHGSRGPGHAAPYLRAVLIALAIAGLMMLAIRAASAETTVQPGERTPVVHATIYRLDSVGSSTRLVPVVVEIPPEIAPISYVINTMAGLKNSPLPAGTRVRSVLVDANGLVTLDFNQAFLRNFHGSDEAEAYAVNSVLMVIGQFAGTRQVKVTVMASPIDSLGGHFDLSLPVDVIRRPAPMYPHRQPRFHYHRQHVAPTSPKPADAETK